MALTGFMYPRYIEHCCKVTYLTERGATNQGTYEEVYASIESVMSHERVLRVWGYHSSRKVVIARGSRVVSVLLPGPPTKSKSNIVCRVFGERARPIFDERFSDEARENAMELLDIFFDYIIGIPCDPLLISMLEFDKILKSCKRSEVNYYESEGSYVFGSVIRTLKGRYLWSPHMIS